ncbi:unnamed protein product, partial [Iphiclides podalirius]
METGSACLQPRSHRTPPVTSRAAYVIHRSALRFKDAFARPLPTNFLETLLCRHTERRKSPQQLVIHIQAIN